MRQLVLPIWRFCTAVPVDVSACNFCWFFTGKSKSFKFQLHKSLARLRSLWNSKYYLISGRRSNSNESRSMDRHTSEVLTVPSASCCLAAPALIALAKRSGRLGKGVGEDRAASQGKRGYHLGKYHRPELLPQSDAERESPATAYRAGYERQRKPRGHRFGSLLSGVPAQRPQAVRRLLRGLSP